MIAGRSISSRLTLWFSSVFFIGLFLFGAVMWFDLKDTLKTGRSRTLDRRADRLSDLLREIDQDPAAVRTRKFQAFADATGGGLIAVFFTDGTRALPSPSSALAFPWPKFATVDREQFREVDFSGQPYLVVARPFVSGSRPLVLYAAASLEGNRPILRTFFAGLLWTAPVLPALAALGGYLLSRRALKPVDQITAATRSISASNLSGRLPVPQTRDELQRLSETCNAMLERLESAVNEIQRFTADASHELRTPLSFIRTVTEVALRNRQADPESRQAFEEVVEECGKASRVLDDLLTLSRADAGNAHFAFEAVDLADLVGTVCEKARLMAIAREHSVTVCRNGARHAPVLGGYSSLRRLVWILLENAAKYTLVPGHIQMTVRADEDNVSVVVEDNGIGISAANLPHIFERFYRADPSRSQVDGAGLGLAIAKWITGVHNARLCVESKEGIGSVFKVVFPALMEPRVKTGLAEISGAIRLARRGRAVSIARVGEAEQGGAPLRDGRMTIQPPTQSHTRGVSRNSIHFERGPVWVNSTGGEASTASAFRSCTASCEATAAQSGSARWPAKGRHSWCACRFS